MPKLAIEFLGVHESAALGVRVNGRVLDSVIKEDPYAVAKKAAMQISDEQEPAEIMHEGTENVLQSGRCMCHNFQFGLPLPFRSSS
jgi:hypothetical protein